MSETEKADSFSLKLSLQPKIVDSKNDGKSLQTASFDFFVDIAQYADVASGYKVESEEFGNEDEPETTWKLGACPSGCTEQTKDWVVVFLRCSSLLDAEKYDGRCFVQGLMKLNDVTNENFFSTILRPGQGHGTAWFLRREECPKGMKLSVKLCWQPLPAQLLCWPSRLYLQDCRTEVRISCHWNLDTWSVVSWSRGTALYSEPFGRQGVVWALFAYYSDHPIGSPGALRAGIWLLHLPEALGSNLNRVTLRLAIDNVERGWVYDKLAEGGSVGWNFGDRKTFLQQSVQELSVEIRYEYLQNEVTAVQADLTAQEDSVKGKKKKKKDKVKKKKNKKKKEKSKSDANNEADLENLA